MDTARISLWLLLCALPFAAAQAQQSDAKAPASAPSQAIPSPDQLEPAVTTSPGTAPSAAVEAPPAAKPAAQPAAAKSAKADKAPARKGPDRVELGTTDITGNRELPKVLYIVPWKRSDLGDLTGRPVNSLLDEVLQPLDRDVFQRQNRYYEGLKPDQAAPKAPAAPAAADKP